jgi:hypothetical protein
MTLVGLIPTSSSPEKQGFSAGRGTDSGTVTDAGKAGDAKEDRWRCFSIRVLKDREFKLASFKWLKEESVEDADDLRRRPHPQSIQPPAHRPALPRPGGPDLRHRPPVFLPTRGAPAPHARTTARLCQAHESIGYALGGDAGSRLTARLSMTIRPYTLLPCSSSRSTAEPASSR